jgi:hypothetical protein
MIIETYFEPNKAFPELPHFVNSEAFDPLRAFAEDADLEDVVTAMEKYRVKRVPVMRGTALVGIVSRANLLHALASLSREVVPGPKTDEAIRDAGLPSWTAGPGRRDR